MQCCFGLKTGEKVTCICGKTLCRKCTSPIHCGCKENLDFLHEHGSIFPRQDGAGAEDWRGRSQQSETADYPCEWNTNKETPLDKIVQRCSKRVTESRAQTNGGRQEFFSCRPPSKYDFVYCSLLYCSFALRIASTHSSLGFALSLIIKPSLAVTINALTNNPNLLSSND